MKPSLQQLSIMVIWAVFVGFVANWRVDASRSPAAAKEGHTVIFDDPGRPRVFREGACQYRDCVDGWCSGIRVEDRDTHGQDGGQ